MSSPFASFTTAPSGPVAILARAVRHIVRGFAALVRAILHRREVTRMLELDDRSLKDIGLVRSDVLGALAEPLSHDPSILLRLRSVDNRARQRALQASARRVKVPERCA